MYILRFSQISVSDSDFRHKKKFLLTYGLGEHTVRFNKFKYGSLVITFEKKQKADLVTRGGDKETDTLKDEEREEASNLREKN